MEFLKVQGHDDLVRDPQTNAIINTNKNEYEEYKVRKESRLKEKQKIKDIESEVSSMKNDLDEIKSLLRSLINENKSWWNKFRKFF